MTTPNGYSEFKPPAWLTRYEKRAFKEVQAARNAADLPLKETEIQVLIDYVRALSRIGTLEAVFSDDEDRMRSNRDPRVKARLISAARQIDITVKLSMELRDRLLGNPAAFPGRGD